MKNSFISILLLTIPLFISCDLKDEFNGQIEMTVEKPEFDLTTPAGSKASELYNKYGLIFKPEFTEAEFSFDWNTIRTNYAKGTTGYRYTPADVNYASEVMDSVEKWVLKVFPDEFISEKLPVNIFMADTICYRYTYSNKIVARIWEGDMTGNYTMVGYTSSRFSSVKSARTLPESWLSLFVEKMISASNLTIPAAFSAISETGYEQGYFSNSVDVVTTYAILKKGRKKQKTGSTTASWYTTTVSQDFGDYVAFIVYVPDSEKATYYAKNANVKTKENIVKDYFLNEFGIELPYIPKNK